MNGVNELTDEIIGAAIEVHRTLHDGHPAPKSMSFQNDLCDLRVLSGEYLTAIRARRARREISLYQNGIDAPNPYRRARRGPHGRVNETCCLGQPQRGTRSPVSTLP